MFYVILIGFLATCACIVGALVYAHKKLPTAAFLLLIGFLALAPVATFKVYERRYNLSHVPDALGVSSMSYQNQESRGFGPGGNEAGILIYPLSEEVSRRIEREGVQFLQTMPPNRDQSNRDWRGVYNNWKETPVASEQWKPKPNPDTGRRDIIDYICAYGFCIDIDPQILKEANEIVGGTGSYYARGRMGIIVVSPGKKRVLYFYSG